VSAESARLPTPRGPLTDWCVDALRRPEQGLARPFPTDLARVDASTDDDLQLALWVLYELHYLGFEDVDPALEWQPELLAFRGLLEQAFESRLRDLTADVVGRGAPPDDDIGPTVFAMCAAADGPDVAAHAARKADREQMLELLVHRSVHQLKEADPQTWLMPRLRGQAKSALLQVQYDEYGAGRTEDMHQRLYARALRACGLDDRYGHYADRVPGTTLAIGNAMSLFGLNRRLAAAGVGYYAAVEATSSRPSQRVSTGLSRLGFGADATQFFDEHVEADAVHEQIAVRDLCGSVVAERPDLRADVLFGVACCLHVEATVGRAVLGAWEAGRSSLYRPAGAGGASAAAVAV
jgi:hypothetical protein